MECIPQTGYLLFCVETHALQIQLERVSLLLRSSRVSSWVWIKVITYWSFLSIRYCGRLNRIH